MQGLILGLGRSHVPLKPLPYNYWVCALEPGNLNYWAHALQYWASALQQEKPLQREACTLQQRVAPAAATREQPAPSNEDPAQPKINKLY